MNQLISPRIFISYSHAGNGPMWKEELLKALSVFDQHHLLDTWEDGKIRISAYWDDDIRKAMESAQVAIILLTQQALESKYILEEEFPTIRDLQKQSKLIVFPVICEPCDWKSHDWLRATQAPNASNPLSDLTSSLQKKVFRKLAINIAEELSRAAIIRFPESDCSSAIKRIYLDRFPITLNSGLVEEKLIGREQELALIDLAFTQTETAIVSLVAWGGVGKTMIVRHWLRHLQQEEWYGINRVYAWSFYSQGTKEDRQVSEDTFLSQALQWFGVQYEPSLSSWDKGRLLAEVVTRERTLLVLDGIEPLQYPPGPMGGQLRAPGVLSLLKQLARKAITKEYRGLCLVTTREPLTDMSDFQRRSNSTWGSLLRIDLSNLTAEAGAALLHHAGVKKAGAAEIKPDDIELLNASMEVDGHALTLNLLGRFLARAHKGDIRRRDLVRFDEADRNIQGGTTFKMLAAFENWFSKGGEFGARRLAILRLLGLFERPADPGCLAALRCLPVINGLTNALFTLRQDVSNDLLSPQPLGEEDWSETVSFLVEFGLISSTLTIPIKVLGFSLEIKTYETLEEEMDDEENSLESRVERGEVEEFTIPPSKSYLFSGITPSESLDCHPLLREYFHKKLQELDRTNDELKVNPSDWEKQSSKNISIIRDGHSRVFTYLLHSVPYWPEGIDGLQYLYQAIWHGSMADLRTESLDCYRERIQRGNNSYSFLRLGAVAEDLSALACFFEIPWHKISSNIPESKHAWLLNETANRLRGLGRLYEALEPMHAARELAVAQGLWTAASLLSESLCKLKMTLGDIFNAEQEAIKSVYYADYKIQNPIYKVEHFDDEENVSSRVFLASVIHQSGRCAEALSLFQISEEMWKKIMCRDRHTENAILINLQGFEYCELLLDEAELNSWYKTTILLDQANTKKDYISKEVDLQESSKSDRSIESSLQLLDKIEMRLKKTFEIYQRSQVDILTTCHSHLTMARCAIYQLILRNDELLQFTNPSKDRDILLSRAISECNTSLDGIRKTNQQRFIPQHLLTRSWLQVLHGNIVSAQTDLDEAWDIAERGSMRLHMADIHLYRARLFYRVKDYPWVSPKEDLTAAEKLINECGYHRRDEELADAKRIILNEKH